MANVKTPVRKYRRGVQYRKGDISKLDIINTFGFKDVKVNSQMYTEKESQSLLNYTYDSLKDLALVLSLFENQMSLNKTGEAVLNIGHVDSTYTNISPKKNGEIAKNWFKVLDHYLGAELGVESVIKNLNELDSNSDIVIETQSLLKTIKKKLNRVDTFVTEYEDANKVLKRIEQILESIEIVKSDDLEHVLAVEKNRIDFITFLDKESLNNMINALKENGVDIGEKEQELVKCLEEIESLYNSEKNKNLYINTNFYSFYKDKSDLDLVSELFNWYVEWYLKSSNFYNNFLIIPTDYNCFKMDVDEESIFVSAIQKYLNIIKPYILASSALSEDTQNVEDIIDTKTIDTVLEEDKGKFKLTLFKKLAKEAGFKIEEGKTEIVEDSYYIPFVDSYILAVKPKKYYAPRKYNMYTMSKYSVLIICQDKDREFSFSNELNYEALISNLVGLVKLCVKAEKFKLTYFKDLCNSHSLNADKGETEETGKIEREYKIIFNKNYIRYIKVPVYIKKNDKLKITIKTLREEVYLDICDTFKYEDILKVLLQIEKEGRKVLIEEKNKLQKEMDSIAKQVEELSKVKEKSDLNNLIKEPLTDKTTKELRERLLKYLELSEWKVQNVYGNINFFMGSSIIKEGLQKFNYSKGLPNMMIEVAIISEDKVSGKSKSWLMNKNSIQIQKRLEDKKQLEGAIEATVHYYLKNMNISGKQKEMLAEGLTYMLCKMYKLDVRTYCIDDKFERLVNGEKVTIMTYLKNVFTLFNKLVLYYI